MIKRLKEEMAHAKYLEQTYFDIEMADLDKLIAVVEAVENIKKYLPTEAELLDYASLNEGRADEWDSAGVRLRKALTALEEE